MTDEHKPAEHKAAKPKRKPPVHKSTRPGQPPAKPPVYQGTVPASRSIPAAAIATTLAAGALIGHALSRMLLRR